MHGTNCARLSPFLYSSAGARLLVVTNATPSAQSRASSRRMIIASATSTTWNSSRHSTEVCLEISEAYSATVSRDFEPPACPSLCSAWCVASMNEWKCSRFLCFPVSPGRHANARSITNVLPQPGPPCRYTPPL